MTSAYRLLGASVLVTWFLSILAWFYVAFKVVTLDLFADANYIYWPLGMIAFVVSFTCFVLYLTFWWRSGPEQSSARRFVRASLLTTWLYSLLLFAYVMARVIINEVPINDPFIDRLLPWFTFLRLAIVAFLLSLLSFLAYLTFSRRSDHRLVAERSS